MTNNPLDSKQSKPLNDDQVEAIAHAAMLHARRLLPIANESTDLPANSLPLPDDLRDPLLVLSRGQALQKGRQSTTRLDDNSIMPRTPFIQHELGRVAREGCENGIPEDVERVMTAAREKIVPYPVTRSTRLTHTNTITASEKRLSDIASLAEAVVEDYVGDKFIDPFAIAKALKIPVLPGDYKGAFDGLIEYRSGQFLIYYDCKHTRGADSSRVRFTIAHELGHYFIDEHREALRTGIAPPHGSRTNFTNANPVEREADTFAANLLLPNSRFSLVAKQVTPNLKMILPISEVFGTSWTSTVLRFVQLNLAPCAIAIIRSDAVAWSWVSPSLAKLAYPTMIRTIGQIPEGATRNILNRPEAFSGGEIASNATTAAFWFLYASGFRDVMLLEEAVSLRDYGVLTFLSLINA